MIQKATSERPQRGEFTFQVDAGLLFQLGEQLVARRSVALAELIKNAYDADATQVTVLLDNVTLPDGTIIIEDNGMGMTFEQVRDHWMRIATNDKLENPESPKFCRARTGAKGVGRFAARRLANKLTLHSVAMRDSGAKEKVTVEFDWESGFKSGQTLTTIPVTYERQQVSKDTPTGVMLYLEDVRDIWEEEDVVDLQRDLFTLISPYPQEEVQTVTSHSGCMPDPGFAFELEIPEYPEYEGELKNQFLAAAWGILTGYIDENGEAHYALDIRETDEHVEFSPENMLFKELSGVRFRIHIFVYKASYFGEFSFGVRDAQRMGRNNGGVRIYLDDFRVFPYGDPGDDWLDVDQKRAGRTSGLLASIDELNKMTELVPGRQEHYLFGNNQLFGAVEISRAQKSIEVNVSRERLVENEAFIQLKRFVQISIDWVTIQYRRVLFESREKQKQEGQESPPSPKVPMIIEQAEERVRESTELSEKSQQEILGILDQAKERAREEEAEHISKLSMLRVLSSTGTMVSILNHQLRSIVDGIRAAHTDLMELRPYIALDAQANYDKALAEIQDWREIVTKQVSQLGFLLGKDAYSRRERLPLRVIVDNMATPLALYRQDFGIEFYNRVPANLRTPPIFEAELHAMLLHLFTNALKAVRNKQVSKIAVIAERENKSLHIFMLDTGSGIEHTQRENVFKPFVTTSIPDPILGVGTGLGLTIVRDTLSAYNGKVRFIDPDRFITQEDPWRTCIEIILPDS